MDVHEQRKEALEITKLMHDYGCVEAKVQASHPNPDILRVVEELLAKHLNGGEILTKILRMSPHQSMLLLECLNADPPYSRDNFNVRITLQNVGDAPVDVLVRKVEHPRYHPRTGEQIDGGDMEAINKTILPGGTATLPAPFAVRALMEFCRQAYTIQGQQRWPHDRDCIREVAYSYSANGEEYSTPKKRGK